MGFQKLQNCRVAKSQISSRVLCKMLSFFLNQYIELKFPGTVNRTVPFQYFRTEIFVVQSETEFLMLMKQKLEMVRVVYENLDRPIVSGVLHSLNLLKTRQVARHE